MCTSCCLGKWIETHYSAIIYYRLKINIIVFTNTSRQTDCNTFYIEFDLSQKKKSMCTSCCLGKWIETHYSAIIYYRLKININCLYKYV